MFVCCSPPWPRSVWVSSWCCCSLSPDWPAWSWCHDRRRPVPILMPGTCHLAGDWATNWSRVRQRHLLAPLLHPADPARLCRTDPSSDNCRRGRQKSPCWSMGNVDKQRAMMVSQATLHSPAHIGGGTNSNKSAEPHVLAEVSAKESSQQLSKPARKRCGVSHLLPQSKPCLSWEHWRFLWLHKNTYSPSQKKASK